MTEQKYYSIGVNKQDFDKFVALHESRPQDKTRAETFHHVMQFFHVDETVHATVKGEE